MNRAQWIAVGGLAVLAVLVLVLALRNPQAPVIPGDTNHVWHGADECLICHDMDAMVPRTANHPVGRDCLHCHGSPR